jgi:CheY-like chemotaxis protein
VVITDVIMPEKDGYEVCQEIKQHPNLAKTPVILMSGVVNRAVAEKAFAVKADELIRKPFQPQDLITRVRHLLQPKASVPAPAAAAATANAALSSIFAAPVSGLPFQSRSAPAAAAKLPANLEIIPAAQRAAVSATPTPRAPVQQAPAPAPVAAPRAPAVPARPAAATSSDVQKIKIEVLRLQGYIKKLKSELEAEREYSRALEEHIKTLQEVD